MVGERSISRSICGFLRFQFLEKVQFVNFVERSKPKSASALRELQKLPDPLSRGYAPYRPTRVVDLRSPCFDPPLVAKS